MQLIKGLCGACGVNLPADEHLKSPDTLLRLAGDCRRANPNAYRAHLNATFAGVVYDVPLIYMQLASLPFRSYVTTNFDPSLKTALDQNPGHCAGVYRYPDAPVQLIQVGRQLFHIHGLIAVDVPAEPDRIVLGDTDFETAYSDEGSAVRSFLQQLLTYNSCCFVGASLNEPELRALFRASSQVRRKIEQTASMHAPPHWALRPFIWRNEPEGGERQRDLDAEHDEADGFRELGVTVVRYDAIDVRHLGLVRRLEQWRKLQPVRMKTGFGPENIE